MTHTRRQFLLAAGGVVGGGALGHGLLTWLARAREAGLHPVSRESFALGSKVSILALHEDETRAALAIDAAFGELELVEQVMSLYRPESELCRLNRHGVLEGPHPYLTRVLRRAREVHDLSGGRFDVTVQPLFELHAAAKRDARLPADTAIANARRRVDGRRVAVSDARVVLELPGMAITLNGIAQGFAADRALAALRAHGIDHALVNAGELGSLGRRANGGPWTAGVQHSRRRDAWIALARLDGRCVATSGDYETTFTEDRVAHHILDPATGRSPRELASVTVAAPSGLDADALSTAVLVLGPEAGLELIERLPGADALLVTKDERVLATRGFPEAAS